MKNIAFFVTGLDSGGIENYLLRFLQYKAGSFDEIIVFCKGGKTGQLEEKYKAIPNVTIHSKKISFFNPKDYSYIHHFLKKHKINSVCDFTGNFAGLILYTAKRANVNKRVSFYRGSTNHFKESKFRLLYNNFVKKMTYKYATNILSNSQSAFDFFYTKQQQDNRFQVIYNGIDATKFDIANRNLRQEFNIPESSFIIGHTGRYNSAKNHTTIIAVAKKLIDKYPAIYFILCGNGVKEGLEKKCERLGISKNVRLFDNRDDIPLFLNTMDAYFFPSITEGQPNALIEAMIIGLPFVASDIQPIKETVENNTNLYHPLDVDGLSLALEKLYLNKTERDFSLKEKTIQRFAHQERFDQFYNKLV